MKTMLAVVAALVAGFWLGGLAPRQDLTEARREARKLQAQISQGKKHTPMSSFAAAVLSRDAGRQAGHSGAAPQTNAQADVRSDDTAARTNAPSRPRTPRPTFAEMIKNHSDLWKVRSELSRNQIVAKAGWTSQDVATFDGIIAEMNAQLAEQVSSWTDYINQTDFINEEMRVRMANDFSATVVAGYDSLYQTMPADSDWRGDSERGDEFEMQDFIDPNVFLPMTNVIEHLEPWPVRR